VIVLPAIAGLPACKTAAASGEAIGVGSAARGGRGAVAAAAVRVNAPIKPVQMVKASWIAAEYACFVRQRFLPPRRALTPLS
jgi:hypothetical protein